MEFIVLAILIRNPKLSADKLQSILTSYGCIIRNRLGINRDEIDGGMIILDLAGDLKQIDCFFTELNNLEGIEYKHIKF